MELMEVYEKYEKILLTDMEKKSPLNKLEFSEND